MVVVLIDPTQSQRYSPEQYRAFQELVGDDSLLHFDPAFAAQTPFERPIAPGFYLLFLAEQAGHLFRAGEQGIQVRFKRPIVATCNGVIGDAVQLDVDDTGMALQYLKQQNGQSKNKMAIGFVDCTAPSTDLEGMIKDSSLRNAVALQRSQVAAVCGGELPQHVPYTLAAATIAPALMKHLPGVIGAYTDVTLHPHERVAARGILLATARYIGTEQDHSVSSYLFSYVVSCNNLPHGFTPIVSGTATVRALQPQ